MSNCKKSGRGWWNPVNRKDPNVFEFKIIGSWGNDDTGTISVEMFNDNAHPLLISMRSRYSYKPCGTFNEYSFPVGYSDYGPIPVEDGDKYCLPISTVLRATFVTHGKPSTCDDSLTADHAHIRGLGVVRSDCDYDKDTEVVGCKAKGIIQLRGQEVKVEDVTIVGAGPDNRHVMLNAQWDCSDGSTGAVVNNVKVLGTWYMSTDGIAATGVDGLVTNSFVMTHDDAYKPMEKDQKFFNNIVWPGTNGWALMFGWEQPGFSGATVTGLDVWHSQRSVKEKDGKTVSPAYIENVFVDNVRILGNVRRVFEFILAPSAFCEPWDPDAGWTYNLECQNQGKFRNFTLGKDWGINMYGCPFFIAASKVAQALADKGAVRECVITRAGSVHVPCWPDADRETYRKLVADEPRTASWQGGSPRVTVDGDAQSAMGASEFLQTYGHLLDGPQELGLPQSAARWWAEATSSSIKPLFVAAYVTGAKAFFEADPAGQEGAARPQTALHEKRGRIVYEDIGSATFGNHSLDRSADVALDKFLSKSCEGLGMGLDGGKVSV
ncbi:hypothetical protein EMIHUDRAFT_220331 [Emiliania huxleyi CCMP1516]|uniref:Uncharacterized protein n=2 Tax=Emiliania huxleyi TaxID=2903 RepID=A0A0D3I1R0_EMIH1|nr:hypothetical protein EMIHUDRAFT_220331 [Emiliania huxleyi CCMP1516]EOD05195.1 hypothetical protein EMIHUDRAFT_220331 [Emiliania huxleyi CCMP1516]|eukprot:XP_005757624.1 hypothetical protein EMIHUDRAFT_220331 [Emiliania huxleyi CCMP1516]